MLHKKFEIKELEAMISGCTPGPWKVGATTALGHVYVGASNPDVGGIVAETGHNDSPLIAAAPALVDALIAEKRAHQKLRAEIEAVLDIVKRETRLHDDEGRFPETVQLGSYVTAQLTRILEADND